MSKVSIVLNLFILVLSICFTSAAIASEKPSIITVSGEGKVQIAPDMAIITASIVSQMETAREALDENNKAMAKVIVALEEKGIEERDIQTSNFNIYPRYHHPKRDKSGEQKSPVIIGYQVSNGLTMRIRDLNMLGQILDQIVTLGVNSGGNISFTNADTAAALRQARTKAVEDAIERAETLTSAAGVTLKRIVTISENSPAPTSFQRQAYTAEARSTDILSVPVASGENEYRVSVQITWEIDQ